MAKTGIMALMGMNHLAWKRHIEVPFLRQGVTLKQFYMLRQLDRRGELQPAQIADMLYCDRPTATVIIGNVEKRGWIERHRNTNDGRSWSIRLTTKGRRALQSLADTRPEGPAFDPLACFATVELDELHRLLLKMHEHLEPLRRGGAACEGPGARPARRAGKGRRMPGART